MGPSVPIEPSNGRHPLPFLDLHTLVLNVHSTKNEALVQYCIRTLVFKTHVLDLSFPSVEDHATRLSLQQCRLFPPEMGMYACTIQAYIDG